MDEQIPNKALKNKEKYLQGSNKKIKKEIDKHRVVKLSTFDKWMYFLMIFMGRCFPTCWWKKHKKLSLLFEEGKSRISKELDIVKIIKTLRYMRILLKNSLLTPEMRFKIEHAERNFINIDLSDDERSQDTSDDDLS